MTSRAAAAIVAAVAVAGGGLFGIAVLAAGGDDSGGSRSGAIQQAPAPSTAAPATSVVDTTTVARAPSASTAATRPPKREPRRSTPSTEPRPTIAPPTTYSAEIDVLAPRHSIAPVGVVIPSLGVDGNVVPTGVNDSAELDVPADARTLVWYQYGPAPGDPGSAVIAGHVDWKGVLGIFHELERTPVGERITVTYDDGSERAFTVTKVDLVDKPAVAVNGTFARDGASVLRLVTCGGEFNEAVSSYYSNVIVTAVPD